ncbi:uncharacterized protein [Glycine max]|uniref:uncharacterized protein n=1 Tax=Glycine max TaxID=3847 RepID=UPI001B355D57|nr:uncharacterized protein LOC121174929 [Glycine max]
MNPPRTEAGLDTIAWKGTADGSFTLKSAYGVVCDLQVTSDINLFKLVHTWPGPERIRMFLWKISHESILTNAKRMRIGMSVNDACSACQAEAEALLHLFRDCNDCKQGHQWKALRVDSDSKEAIDLLEGGYVGDHQSTTW